MSNTVYLQEGVFDPTGFDNLESWLRAHYSLERIAIIAERGCDRGTLGVSYYSQTSPVYEQFKEELWRMLADEKRRVAPGKMMLEWFALETCKSAIPGSFTNDDGDIILPEKFEQRVVWYCIRMLAKKITASSDKEE